MEIRTLRYFLEIARTENITRAAEILHVSQPSLSKQIHALEEELGKKLFQRHSKSISLTEEGLLLKQRAGEIIEIADKTKKEFQTLDDITGGDIYIGCAESDGFKYFVRAAVKLKEICPRVRYHLYSGDSDTVTDKLDRGLLDFALIAHDKINFEKYNHTTFPTKNLWGIILRKDSPLARKKNFTCDELTEIPIICSRQGLDEELLDLLGEKRDKLNIVATYDLMFNAAIMMREGLGYLLGYDKIIDTGEGSELCFRPLFPQKESPMYIIWKKHKIFTPVAEMLLKNLVSQNW